MKNNLVKLIILSILAANIGYTLFLMPVLGFIYPDKVPLSIVNIISFAVVNSLAGILLGLSIHFLSKTFVKGVLKAAGLSIVMLWLLYWLPGLKNLDIEILCLDGIAAFITWSAFVIVKHGFQMNRL